MATWWAKGRVSLPTVSHKSRAYVWPLCPRFCDAPETARKGPCSGRLGTRPRRQPVLGLASSWRWSGQRRVLSTERKCSSGDECLLCHRKWQPFLVCARETVHFPDFHGHVLLTHIPSWKQDESPPPNPERFQKCTPRRTTFVQLSLSSLGLSPCLKCMCCYTAFSFPEFSS